eukprot:88931-Pelagomonas_calceolata.AAC.2
MPGPEVHDKPTEINGLIWARIERTQCAIVLHLSKPVQAAKNWGPAFTRKTASAHVNICPQHLAECCAIAAQ